MPADDRVAETVALRRRYPRWTIWFGPATGHWFALPPRDRDIGGLVEVATIQKLISVIEVVQHAPLHDDSRQDLRNPSDLLRPEGDPRPRTRRVPVDAWPGSISR
ncbi:MAG: hypothetical protein QOE54_5745 [Streptosporangiaceae bacterium]|jgi:hypothetical protein|nr:hypothetical protein [Streptosporangiaceae bacterium]MDX6433379.1 hypothetical protein [Streptosporangiaceae bacterium]